MSCKTGTLPTIRSALNSCGMILIEVNDMNPHGRQFVESDRGKRVKEFGRRAIKKFLAENKMTHMVRGHEVVRRATTLRTEGW